MGNGKWKRENKNENGKGIASGKSKNKKENGQKTKNKSKKLKNQKAKKQKTKNCFVAAIFSPISTRAVGGLEFQGNAESVFFLRFRRFVFYRFRVCFFIFFRAETSLCPRGTFFNRFASFSTRLQ